MRSPLPALPEPFAGWFATRGWAPHEHQLALLAADRAGRSTLLIAPTGGGKTLAGFLPTLIDLAEAPRRGLHTLYISPLKALAVDIHRNLEQPIAEMRLAITSETRTGDTPAAKRQRQRKRPPAILMTTPESLALMLSYPDADRLFGGLARVVIDELHALAGAKRGDLLALGLARLARLAPAARRVGLSATVADEAALVAWLSPTGKAADAPVQLVRGRAGSAAEVAILTTREYFIQQLVPGDSFVFGGQLLRFEGIRETVAEVSRGSGDAPKIPIYAGGRLPLTTQLAERVRSLLAEPGRWRILPPAVREWLELQRRRSLLPDRDGLLVETFPRGRKEFLVAYCFEGRNAHQTLGMLLTRRMERAGLGPLGFVATDYVLAVWSLKPARDLAQLFDQDMLGDDLEAWMDESSMLRRTFRNVAVIAGLIERRHPGTEKTGRQVLFSSDLIYDVLRKHEPGHILLRATRADAAGGLTDLRRLADMLARIGGRITHRRLDRVSPLAVPVLLEIGKVSVYGAAVDDLLDEAASELIAEATAEDEVPELPL